MPLKIRLFKKQHIIIIIIIQLLVSKHNYTGITFSATNALLSIRALLNIKDLRKKHKIIIELGTIKFLKIVLCLNISLTMKSVLLRFKNYD